MNIKFGLTKQFINTQYAPLGVLLAHYQQNQVLKPLKQVQIKMRTRDFTAHDKLQQVFVSILTQCQTLSEVNSRLSTETSLAKTYQWPRFADQATLSRTLDRLSLMNIEQLRAATSAISAGYSATRKHDWRGFLWLDFDLSGLPCGPRAEKSQRGYFSGKKTSLVAS
jgi:hypothetical protein